ncbi:unnamed protein product [Schistosoma rodhaini]|uniref:Uncharacterized protein n=1 Tax=Schistosoma rodhaini TaxID=6188 RepID=A0AA85G7R7_9TREM|nr:unnamed protein product [Schistosoma rodhaini]
MHEINIDDINLSSGFSHARYASVVSALGVNNRKLFIGSSSISGDLWGGGLVVYNLKNVKNYFGRIAYEDESAVVDDISQQVVTETSFDSSVASIAALNLSCSELTDAVVIGLDDGSIQLVTLREVSANSHQSQMQPLTINSATYHDWPLDKVIASQTSGSTNPHIITLDVAGCVKLWDCPSLMPIKSWSINSTTWPVNGSAFTPDISLLSSNNTNDIINDQNNCENFLLSTLNPLDLKRKICLWDIRINDVSNPLVIQSSDCSNIKHDLPTALSWLSPHHLLLGTYEGHLYVYDIRNPKMELSNVDVTDTNETFKSSSHRCKQIIQILTHNYAETSTKNISNTSKYIGLIQINGSIDVYQQNVSNDMFTHVYHNDGKSITNIDNKFYGRVKPCGLFISSDLINSKQPWKLLLSTGIPDNNNNNNNNLSLANTSLYTANMNDHKTLPTKLDYQLCVHPNLIETNIPGFNNLSRIHYIKFFNI